MASEHLIYNPNSFKALNPKTIYKISATFKIPLASMPLSGAVTLGIGLIGSKTATGAESDLVICGGGYIRSQACTGAFYHCYNGLVKDIIGIAGDKWITLEGYTSNLYSDINENGTYDAAPNVDAPGRIYSNSASAIFITPLIHIKNSHATSGFNIEFDSIILEELTTSISPKGITTGTITSSTSIFVGNNVKIDGANANIVFSNNITGGGAELVKIGNLGGSAGIEIRDNSNNLVFKANNTGRAEIQNLWVGNGGLNGGNSSSIFKLWDEAGIAKFYIGSQATTGASQSTGWLNWDGNKLWIGGNVDMTGAKEGMLSWSKLNNIPNIKTTSTYTGTTDPYLVQPIFSRASSALGLDGKTIIQSGQPRIYDGKFGKALYIEEGTTNLITHPLRTSTCFAYGAVGSTSIVSTDTSYRSNNSIKYTWNGTVSTNYFYISDGYLAETPSTVFTVSCKVKRADNAPIGTVSGFLYSPVEGNVVQAATVTPIDNGWTNIVYSRALSASGKLTVAGIYFTNAAAVSGDSYYIDDLQVEIKDHATQFTEYNTTRISDALKIPTAGVMDSGKGTIEMWIKRVNPANGNYAWIFTTGTAATNYLRLFAQSGGTFGFLYGTPTSDANYYPTSTFIVDNNWHHIAVTWENNVGINLYYDGALKQAGVKTPTITPSQYLQLGNPSDNLEINALFDDIRISNIVRSAAEISGAYISNKPTVIDRYTTAYVPFDTTDTWTDTTNSNSPTLKINNGINWTEAATHGAPPGSLVGSTAASAVESNASSGATAFTGTADLRTKLSPSASGAFGTIVPSPTIDGNAIIKVPYTYTQGTTAADWLNIYRKEGGGTVLATDECFSTSPTAGDIYFTCKPGTVYTFGIQASRRAEGGIYSTGIITSSSITASGSNFTGNINGTSASTVVSNALSAFNGTIDYRNSNVPSSSPVITSWSTSATADGNVIAFIDYTYTQGAVEADGLLVYIKEGAIAITTSDTCFMTNAVSGKFIYPVKPNTQYRFNMQAVKSVATGFSATSLIVSDKTLTSALSVYSGSLNRNLAFASNLKPKLILARGNASGLVATADRIDALGYPIHMAIPVTAGFGWTVAQCKPYNIIVTDHYVYPADGSNQFIKDAFESGAKVLVLGNDSRTGLFYITGAVPCGGSPGRRTIAWSDGIIQHPVHTGVSSLTLDNDSNGYWITDIIPEAKIISKHVSGGIADVFYFTNNKGGMIVHAQSPLTQDDQFLTNIIEFMAGNFLVNTNEIDYLDNKPATTVVSEAGSGAEAFDGTTSYRTSGYPDGVISSLTASSTSTADGNILATISFNYTQGAKKADTFYIFSKTPSGATALTYTDPAIASNAITGTSTFTMIVKPDSTYRVGVCAGRRTELGIEVTPITSTSFATSGSDYKGTINGMAADTLTAQAISGAAALGKFSGSGGKLPPGNVTFNYADSTSQGGYAVNTNNVGAYTSATITGATLNFNSRNDRDGSQISSPYISAGSTSIDHTLNKDGSANISMEWIYSGAASAIDGFIVYVSDAGTGSPSSQLTSSSLSGTGTGKDISVFYVTPERRAFVFNGIPADHWYGFGIQAYRLVDTDIAPNGIMTSLISVSISGDAGMQFGYYQPSLEVEFNGNVLGTINGVGASTISSYAASGKAALDKLTEIAADNKITQIEKPDIFAEWQNIYYENIADKITINTSASTGPLYSGGIQSIGKALGLVEESNYTDAFDTLATYCGAGALNISSPPTSANGATWIANTSTITIVPEVLRANFLNYYDTRERLLTKITSIDYIGSSDALKLGFNPTFSLWTTTGTNDLPLGWSFGPGTYPTRNTDRTYIRTGTSSIRFDATSTSQWIHKQFNFGEPLALKDFIEGSVDVYISNVVSGAPTLLLRSFTTSACSITPPSGYEDLVKISPTASGWNTINFTARPSYGKQIYGIDLFLMASWQSFPSVHFTGTCYFDNLRFNIISGKSDDRLISETAGVFKVETGTGNIFATGNIVLQDNGYIKTENKGFNGSGTGIIYGKDAASGTVFNVGTGGWNSITPHMMWSESASALEVTGTINATSGNFKGNITSTATISGGTIVGSNIYGATITGGAISGGTINIGNNFSVNSSGVMTCNGANIRGTLNATDIRAAGDQTNLVLKPYFIDTNVGGWASAGTQTSIAVASGGVIAGGPKVLSGKSGWNTIYEWGNYIPVSYKDNLSVSGWITSISSSGDCLIGILWYTANNISIPASAGGESWGPRKAPKTGWEKHSFSVIAPSGASYGIPCIHQSLFVQSMNSGTGGWITWPGDNTSSYVYFSDLSITRQGIISADQINGGVINGQTISGGTIVGAIINGSTLTTCKQTTVNSYELINQKYEVTVSDASIFSVSTTAYGGYITGNLQYTFSYTGKTNNILTGVVPVAPKGSGLVFPPEPGCTIFPIDGKGAVRIDKDYGEMSIFARPTELQAPLELFNVGLRGTGSSDYYIAEAGGPIYTGAVMRMSNNSSSTTTSIRNYGNGFALTVESVDSDAARFSSRDGAGLSISSTNGSPLYISPRSGAPTVPPSNGSIYFDSSTSKLRVYINGWKDVITT